MIDGFVALYVFMLAAFVGNEIISKVPVVLHTPLMSGSNFIHGIVDLPGGEVHQLYLLQRIDRLVHDPANLVDARVRPLPQLGQYLEVAHRHFILLL